MIKVFFYNNPAYSQELHICHFVSPARRIQFKACYSRLQYCFTVMKSWQLWLLVQRIKSVEKVRIASHCTQAKDKLAGIKTEEEKICRGEKQGNQTAFHIGTWAEANGLWDRFWHHWHLCRVLELIKSLRCKQEPILAKCTLPHGNWYFPFPASLEIHKSFELISFPA